MRIWRALASLVGHVNSCNAIWTRGNATQVVSFVASSAIWQLQVALIRQQCSMRCSHRCTSLTILYALWKHRCHSLGALVKDVPKDIGGGCSHELLKNVRGLRDVV